MGEALEQLAHADEQIAELALIVETAEEVWG